MSDRTETKGDLSEEHSLKHAMEQLTAKLEQTYTAQSAVSRQGRTIVIPEFLSYDEAANAILSYQKEMETVETKVLTFMGHVEDMLVALNRGMINTFGHAVGSTIQGLFSSTPGAINVKVGYDETLTVPFGKISIPGLPVTFDVQTAARPNPLEGILQVTAKCKRKYMPLVNEIEKAVRQELRTNSIFRKKAIDSRFQFLNINGFDVNRVVHSMQEELDLEANIFQFIRHTQKAREAGLNLKRTVLLHGNYGTGKTLTALSIAKTAQENGWTFINVLPGDEITPALTFAKNYQPCVVFFEDIDQVTNGERDAGVNQILNTIDGILSKNAEVLTILTTNHVERVERAMLRPGRIDAIIELGKIDERALTRLIASTVREHGGRYNIAELLTIVEGFTPAFVVEGCQRAVLYALAAGRKVITQEDLAASLAGLRGQYNLMMSDRSVRPASLDERFSEVVHSVIQEEKKKGTFES